MFKKKRYTEKDRVKTDEWLKQFNRSLADLPEAQQEIILEHLKRLQLKKWIWLYFVAGFIWLIAGFYGYFVSMDCIQQDMETIAGTGTENFDPLLIKEIALIQYQISGMSFACFIVALLSFFTICMVLYHCAKNEKIIKVFLKNSKN